ncbi:hypothetical protein P3S68_030769 [Capsicum galapagoense]
MESLSYSLWEPYLEFNSEGAGLEKADEAIEKVREDVKHIKHSKGRILKFLECIKNHGLSCSKKLRQDVTTPYV